MNVCRTRVNTEPHVSIMSMAMNVCVTTGGPGFTVKQVIIIVDQIMMLGNFMN